MSRSRISEFWDVPVSTAESTGDCSSSSRSLPLSGFVMCPLVLVPVDVTGLQQLYRLAFERAQAVVRPSRLERLQRVSVN
jgi:hypothetical protein